MTRIVSVILLLLLASAASATELWLDVALGRNALNLSEVTDGSVTYRGYDLEDGTLDSGTSLCGTLAFVVSRDWSLGLSYDRLEVETNGAWSNATVAAKLPAHYFRAIARWRPLRVGRAVWSVTGGLGLVDVSGTATTSGDPTFALQGQMDGTGLVAEVGLSLRYMIQPRVGLFLDGGVRRAHVGSMTAAGETLRRDDDGVVVPFDFGGTYLKAGVTMLLPSNATNPE